MFASRKFEGNVTENDADDAPDPNASKPNEVKIGIADEAIESSCFFVICTWSTSLPRLCCNVCIGLKGVAAIVQMTGGIRARQLVQCLLVFTALMPGTAQ